MITKIKKKRNEDKHVFGPSVQDCGVVDKYNVVSQRTREEEMQNFSTILCCFSSNPAQNGKKNPISATNERSQTSKRLVWWD
jgi:hypothetical protein